MLFQSVIHALILPSSSRVVKPQGTVRCPHFWLPALGPLTLLLLLTGCMAPEQLCPSCPACPQTGRFSMYHTSGRTWRLDSVTGENCLLLAQDADWKKPDISAQGCR